MSELSSPNYKRIFIINSVFTTPLFVLFAWPYHYATQLFGLDIAYRYAGAFVFSLPFVLTILHGHVTMALGSVHRHHYYQWLEQHPLSWGLFYHPMFVSTRFRLILLAISLLLLLIGGTLSYQPG